MKVGEKHYTFTDDNSEKFKVKVLEKWKMLWYHDRRSATQHVVAQNILIK